MGIRGEQATSKQATSKQANSKEQQDFVYQDSSDQPRGRHVIIPLVVCFF